MAALTNMMNGDRFPSTGAVRDVRLTSSTPGDHRQDNVRLRLFNLEEPAMDEFKIRVVPRPWNKGKLVGQKARRSN